jgi:hypothetical protein
VCFRIMLVSRGRHKEGTPDDEATVQCRSSHHMMDKPAGIIDKFPASDDDRSAQGKSATSFGADLRSLSSFTETVWKC